MQHEIRGFYRMSPVFRPSKNNFKLLISAYNFTKLVLDKIYADSI